MGTPTQSSHESRAQRHHMPPPPGHMETAATEDDTASPISACSLVALPGLLPRRGLQSSAQGEGTSREAVLLS